MQLKKYSIQVTLLFSLLVILLASCRKEYSIENHNNTLAAGNWQFTEGGKEFAGDMDTTFIIDGNSANELHLVGTSNDGSQSFHMVLYTADSFKAGTYLASAYQSSFEYGSVVPPLYAAGQLNGQFTVTITSINESLVTGTFSGKAVKNGQDTVEITNGMFKSVFENATAQPTSSGVLGDSAGNCKPVALAGIFKQGVALNPGNTVTVQVSVAVPGTYDIHTDIANGVSFTAKGSFAQAGSQTITLTGGGVPEESGEKQFTVHFGNSQCAFKINFEQGTAPSGDYYPLTNQSDWTYTDGIDDEITKITGGTFSWNGKNYSVIGVYDDLNDPQPFDTFGVIRKGGGLYYTYNDFAYLIQSNQPVIVENIFLKDNVPQGTSWDGPEFSKNVNGTLIKYHFKFTILAKGVSATMGGFNFPDIIKVRGELYSGNTNLGIQEERWYAKNVGLIYFGGDITGKWTIKDYHIF